MAGLCWIARVTSYQLNPSREPTPRCATTARRPSWGLTLTVPLHLYYGTSTRAGPAVALIAASQAAAKQQVRPCTSASCMHAGAPSFPNSKLIEA